jgi:outer membrane lipoprotein-sorting protein
MLAIALASILLVTLGGAGLAGSPHTTDEVVAAMMSRDAERIAALHGYTAMRRYELENRGRHKRAEMLVKVTGHEDGSRTFETVSESGWSIVLKHVFPRLLEAEVESSRPDARDRSRITPENYSFEMLGTEEVRDRPAYVMAIEPKTKNKFLMRGRIWVDAEDYAIVRIEGQPAKNPSFWTRSVHFRHEYKKNGVFWFPMRNDSVNDVRIVGTTEMRIEYFDYAVTENHKGD